MKKTLLIILAMLLFSCASTEKEVKNEPVSFKKAVIEKLGKNHEILESPSKTRILAFTKKEDNSTNDRIIKLHCIVYDKQKKEVIFEKTYDNASISWESDSKLKLRITPGILTTDEKLNEELRVKYVDLRN